DLLQEALRDSVRKSFNRISVDGDTSTNDMVAILANGLAKNIAIDKDTPYYQIFKCALDFICIEMAKLVAKDGEGATKLLECYVDGAKTQEQALNIAKTIVSSTLVKTAMFGSDANWGRVLCSIGYSGEDVDISKIDIIFESMKGYVQVCSNGNAVDFDEEFAKSILENDEISIIINLKIGSSAANAWGCDLTYDYVRISGNYRN
ncbi:MAG: bifunctional ornithine acetyltransferase/N-acetylglutamate synthase, partial [Clostridioides sp.]|nr:bifunctional ornithine acetyltransferase/N-acetylglutamate synthase [Clostridioides sp.]